jgi:uncharacterized RmlC-like cupin family protein
MRLVKPSADRVVPRGVVGGAEVSAATVGASSLYMSVFRLEPGARSRPHYHAQCESACLMLSGEMVVSYGDGLEEQLTVRPGDMLFVPPHETHVLFNPHAATAAEYVVARNSATEDSVEVPWAG